MTNFPPSAPRSQQDEAWEKNHRAVKEKDEATIALKLLTDAHFHLAAFALEAHAVYRDVPADIVMCKSKAQSYFGLNDADLARLTSRPSKKQKNAKDYLVADLVRAAAAKHGWGKAADLFLHAFDEGDGLALVKSMEWLIQRVEEMFPQLKVQAIDDGAAKIQKTENERRAKARRFSAESKEADVSAANAAAMGALHAKRHRMCSASSSRQPTVETSSPSWCGTPARRAGAAPPPTGCPSTSSNRDSS